MLWLCNLPFNMLKHIRHCIRFFLFEELPRSFLTHYRPGQSHPRLAPQLFASVYVFTISPQTPWPLSIWN